MNHENQLSGKKVLVTGATGFIGSRLVNYLTFACGAEVRALVRNFGHAVEIARLPVDLVPGNLTDLASLRKAVSGAEIIFHCAAGTVGEDEERLASTVEGTRNMLQAAAEARVERFVYVSTVAVHGPDPGPVVDETTPLVRSNDLYADSKLEAEQLVAKFGSDTGLPVVILRPTIVYGPRSGAWTVGPVTNIQNGTLSLIDGGQGIANQVYVDDVVQALLLAAIRPQATGETFLISGANPVTWEEFFGYYADMLGCELLNITTERITYLREQLSHLRSPWYMSSTFIASPHARSIVKQIKAIDMPMRMVSRLIPRQIRDPMTKQAAELREVKLHPPRLPKPWLVSLYTAKGVCKIEKAQRLLGYQPQVNLEEGMRMTEAWLRYNRLISEN